jgi:hypothetical protein
MKMRKLFFMWTLCTLTVCVDVQGANPCIESGPHYGSWGDWSCSSIGSLSAGSLTSTSQTVCVGGSVNTPDDGGSSSVSDG